MAGRPRPPIPFNRLVRLLVLALVVAFSVRLLVGALHEERAAPSPSPEPRATATGRVRPLPPCTQEDKRAKRFEQGAWASTLVDTAYALPPSYAPDDLVPVSQAGFTEPFVIRRIVIADLTALRAAAADAGNAVGLAAAYRSWATQDSLFHRRADDQGSGLARAKTARAGHSEHQLGTTLDFKTQGAPDVDAAWEATPAGKWMAANAWRYGFVMSYPAGALDEVCYWYEPWHYRYVGREKAKQVHESELTLRAYLWREQEQERLASLAGAGG
jgi:D-alanyl-D-alanine carboxypeptidase